MLSISKLNFRFVDSGFYRTGHRRVSKNLLNLLTVRKKQVVVVLFSPPGGFL